jgi:hypothetical protein
MAMTATFLALVLAGWWPGDPPTIDKTDRKPNPLAPSLPELTDEEEAQFDEIIDRFIDYDSGRSTGEDAKQVRQDFDKLGPDATLALIRGLNRAAKIQHSCPAVTIARKLNRILGASQDPELLQFARENIGAGVGSTRHSVVLADLRTACMLRKNELARAGITQAPVTLPSAERLTGEKSLGELVEAAGRERGPQLKKVLAELGQRRGDLALAALASAAAASYDDDMKKFAREQLTRSLSRLPVKELKEKLKDDRPETRAATARLAGEKQLPWGDGLIELLQDDAALVRQAAHQALVRLNKGEDLGPAKEDDATEWAAAVAKWKAWWANRAP